MIFTKKNIKKTMVAYEKVDNPTFDFVRRIKGLAIFAHLIPIFILSLDALSSVILAIVRYFTTVLFT